MAIGIGVSSAQAFSPQLQVAPLSSGDRLVRAEFERRYTAHPEITKAKRVEGVVYAG